MPSRDLFLTLAAGMLLAGAAPAQNSKPAQPSKPADAPMGQARPAPAPGSVEALINDALKSNPDILAAQARLREAEIQLNKVRSEVMVQISVQHTVVKNAREMVNSLEQVHKIKEEQFKRGILPSAEVAQSQAELSRSRTEVAKLEAELIKLVGRVPGQAPMPTLFSTDAVWIDFGNDTRLYPAFIGDRFNPALNWDQGYLRNLNVMPNPSAGAPAASIADKLREALQRPLKIDVFESAPTVKSLLRHLREHGLSGVPIRVLLGHNEKVENELVELVPGELPLAAWLTVVQDSVPEIRFVVREYGLLVTTADRAPRDGLLLADFLRRSKAPDSKPKENRKEDETKP